MFRNREDVSKSIARPTNVTDSARNRNLDISRTGANNAGSNNAGSTGTAGTFSRSGSTAGDISRTTGTGRNLSNFQTNDTVARSIARPQVGASRITQPNNVASRINTGAGQSNPTVMSKTTTSGNSATVNRSLPISRTRDNLTQGSAKPTFGTMGSPTVGSTNRPTIGTGDRATTRSLTRTAPDIARNPQTFATKATGSNPLVARDLSNRTFTRSASPAGNDSFRAANAVRRDGTVRTAAFHDSHTVAYGKIGNREFTVREAHGPHGKDVYVINAGHFHPDHWPHGDYRPYHGDWHHGDWHHGGWGHGPWYHGPWGPAPFVSVGVSFTFVHSYCAQPA
ncbi:MAG: hypothetical protein QM765_44690 [Myxococcales bacterium]